MYQYKLNMSNPSTSDYIKLGVALLAIILLIVLVVTLLSSSNENFVLIDGKLYGKLGGYGQYKWDQLCPEISGPNPYDCDVKNPNNCNKDE